MSKLKLLLSVVFCTGSISLTEASTFQLFYDGIVSPQVIQIYQDEPSNATTTPIPYSMVSDLSTSFMTDVIQTLVKAKDPAKSDSDFTEEERTLDMDQRCYQDKSGGGRCTVDHERDGGDVWIHIDTDFYSHQNQALLRLQVSLTYSETMLVKDVLVKCVPKINDHIKHFNGVVWSIDERLNPLDLTHASTVAESQHRADLKASSVTTLFLAQPTLKNRMRIASNMTHTNAWEVWQYQDVTFSAPVRSLFVNGHLLTTTHPAGTAHAEALVHPALIASANPDVIAILSLDPTSVLKEVLKHKGVKKVVLLGIDSAVAATTQKFMPNMDDCSFLGTEVTSCLKQPIVEIVDELSAQDWMKAGAKAVLAAPDIETYNGYVDVVLVDVPVWNDEWLDVGCHKYLYGNLDDESIVVVAAGAQPKLFETVDDVLSPRDHFMRQVIRTVSHEGLGYSVGNVYDEPLAVPLASAFLVFFVDTAKSYSLFVRINSPAIETDVIEKLHTNIAVLPTLIYDGMTHRKYNTMSRAWEHWYCKTLPGRNLPICKSFLERWYNSNNHFYGAEVRQDPVKGRALVAVEDCPAGSFVLAHDAGLNMRLDRQQWLALNKFVKDFPGAEMYKQLRDFILTYGFESETLGTTGWSVSIACNNTFTNHGCTPEQINIKWMAEMYFGEDDAPDTPFCPPLYRKSELFGILVEAARDVKAGEEFMSDYSTFRESLDHDVGFTKFLSAMCDKGIGLVPANEAGTQEYVYEGCTDETQQ